MTDKARMKDEESLSFLHHNNRKGKHDNDNDKMAEKRANPTAAPLPPKQYMIFFMGATAILFLTCLYTVFQPTSLRLKETVRLAHLDGNAGDTYPEAADDETSTISKKWNPFPPKPTGGNVRYTSYATEKDGMVYKREFTMPCDYGVLVFNIGPAPIDQPYDFEIYDDAYLWSNNDNMCFLYPHYKAYQVGHEPFWESTDPSYQRLPHVNSKKVTRISTKVNRQAHAKTIDSAIKAKGGDYVVMAKGHFWSPHYWDDLRSQVHSWKKKKTADNDVDMIQSNLENWVLSLE